MAGATIATITAPQLQSVMGEELSAFKIKYETYLNKVEEFNRGRTPAQRIPPAGIKNCIDPELLRLLVLLQTFPGVKTTETLTSDQIKTWVETRCRVSHKAIDSQVTDALSRVKFKTNSADPRGAVLQFFTSVTTELARNRATHVMTDAPKDLVQQLVTKLEPRILRGKMQSSMKYWKDEDRKNFHYFAAQVTTTYVDIATYIDDPLSNSKGDDHRGAKHRNKNCKERDDHVAPVKGIQRGNEKPDGGSNDNEGAPKRSKKRKEMEWTDPYLNKKCDKRHRVKDCDATPPEEKKRLLQEYYDSKKKPKAAAFKRGQLGDGRWKAEINDAVDTIALGDYGADESALPKNVLKLLQERGSVVSVQSFKEPIHLAPAIGLNQDTFTASAKGLFDITVCLPCGPLRLRKVDFLVVDQHMDEILLGRTLLKCLGFNLDSHLQKVRDKFKEADMRELMNNSEEDEKDSTESAKAASLAPYTGLWYNQSEEDPTELPEAAGESIGVDREDEVQAAFKNMGTDARNNGMSEKGIKHAEAMLQEYRDIFRINLGADPPAKVEPLEIKLKPHHRPVRTKQRKYTPKHHAFIETAVRELRSVGAIRKKPQARWASPALAVPKPGSDKLRFTVDLRAPNRETIPIASAMLDLEHMIQTTAGSQCFAKSDMCHAYWQIPLHRESQECMSIQTPLGVHTPVRLLQGQTDAGNHFQSVTSPIFSEVIEKFIQWLDDFLLHAKHEEELLNIVSIFFNQCRKYGLKLHAKKCELFLKEANFCGRIIDVSGIRYNPRELDTLLKMRKPEFASDLQQFLCATNWMRKGIPEYSKIIAPLHILMEECYTKARKRTKRAVKNISLSGLWGLLTTLPSSRSSLK